MITALLYIAAIITGAIAVAIVLSVVFILTALVTAYPAESVTLVILLCIGYIVGQSIFEYLGWL